MSSRAVLLPTPGDPLLLHYWIENYRKIYKSQVDKLYVCLNTPAEKEVVEYIQEMLDGVGATHIYIDHQIEHGDAINRLLDIVEEELVVLVEDDCFVINGDKIRECFSKIESGEFDCVGSKRGSCSFEILDKANELWGIKSEGFGDQGCNFWPNMFFCKKKDLLKTDRNFGARAWSKGELVVPLNYIMQEEGAGDTFVNTSLQLRAMELNIGYVNQYHASPDDDQDFDRSTNLFDGFCPWIHVGSLSSGVGGVLTDDEGRPLATRLTSEPKPFVVKNGSIKEWARRIQMWQTFYDNSDPEKIPDFREAYRRALEKLYTECKVNRKMVKQRQAMYKTLGL